MSEPAAAQSDSVFRVPTNMQEFTALALSLLTVFVLIQFGAPIIRDLDFLDQKLRDYFLGISFAAFPVIHRGCKRGLAGFNADATPVRRDLAPWFVSGVVAAALLFAWNQFVSFLGSFAIGIVLGQVPNVDANAPATMQGMIIGTLAVSLPLSAAASIFAGVLLNRHTRSHVFLALTTAAVFFLVFNVFLTWLAQPDYLVAQFAAAADGGTVGVLQFLLGIALVGVIIFVFGVVGILISRFNREGSIGRLMDVARRLSPGDRERLAADINRRLEARAHGGAPMAASPVTMPAQMAGGAEP